MFPSPCWGLFFYLDVYVKTNGKIYVGFRPRAGDYFFIVRTYQIVQTIQYQFPSPCWGLFFYRIVYSLKGLQGDCYRFPSPCWGLFFIKINYLYKGDTNMCVGFRPRAGDYFFIVMVQANVKALDWQCSFRPRAGDYFFIQSQPIKLFVIQLFSFPSPYWGLFFYPYPLQL